jgi:hypothetical protein
MTVRVVLARYREPVAWAAQLASRDVEVLVYNHGRPLAVLPPGVEEVHLANVGREAGCYLTHIVSYYDDLADWTVFSQADPADHLRVRGVGDLDFRTLLTPRPGLAGFVLLLGLREWDRGGLLRHWGPWLEKYNSQAMRHSPWSFRAWMRRFAGVDIDARGALAYFPGAIFGASREVIRRRPLRLWQDLLSQVQDHRDPEEAYYLERAWPYLLGGEDVPVWSAVVLEPDGTGQFRVAAKGE